MTSAPIGRPNRHELPGTLFWQEPGSEDPDLSFRFVAPHGARVTITAPILGFILRRLQKPPELHCRQNAEGWSLTVVVGLSKVFLSTRALRLPATGGWRPALARFLDRPLRGLVRAHLSFAGEGGWRAIASQSQARGSLPVSVEQRPPAQDFRQHLPLAVALPDSAI